MGEGQCGEENTGWTDKGQRQIGSGKAQEEEEDDRRLEKGAGSGLGSKTR